MASEAFALLPQTVITAAGTVVGDPYLLGPIEAEAVIAEAIFTYGSGGTSAKLYLQTSLDGGATWVDAASFAFATTTASKVSAISTGIAPASQAFAPSDGALTDDTVINGVVGDRLRVKLVSVGTYAGNTRLACWVSLKGGRRS